jgi:hypothetical protein
MSDYNKIINIISIILILLILFVILFGCQYQKYNYYERFENNEKEKEKETKPEDANNLSSFEQSILKGLTDGSLKTDNLSSLIKEEKFTEHNLNNIIQHVEKFKGNV